MKTVNLVKGTEWNGFIELNRMAFDEYLPKNSESRCIAITLRMIKKNAPHIKWVISFADGTQCGDGTIYRASGFKLVGIAKNTSLRINPKTNEKIHIIQAHHLKITSKEFRSWQPLIGYQFKYVYFIDKSKEKDLTIPILPFNKIDDFNAGMYKGQKISYKERNVRQQFKDKTLYIPVQKRRFNTDPDAPRIMTDENILQNNNGMELDPKYTDVIVQRYVDYTGNNKIKKNGKEINW